MLTAVAIPASVSRSAVIGIVLSIGLFVVLMPPRQRMTAFILMPVGLAAVFMVSHGELGTLVGWLGYGSGGTDPSVTHRTNNYPYVAHLVSQAPLLGSGGNTYLPDVVHILDDEWLDIAINLGYVGVFAFAVLFIAPLVTALKARARSTDPSLRLLCAALASGFLTAGVCSAFFDSFSFPLLYSVFAARAWACRSLLALGQVGVGKSSSLTFRPWSLGSVSLRPDALSAHKETDYGPSRDGSDGAAL